MENKKPKNLLLPINKMEFQKLENSSLSKCKIYVMHTGENLNNSSFDREAVDKARNTLKNIPILASIKRDEDYNAVDFEGHEMETRLIERSNGDYDFKVIYIEKPIGVIPETNNYRIERLDNGEEWVVCDGYIWNEYANDAYNLLKGDGKKVSMEISVQDGYFDDNFIYNIKNYQYLGVTVLGDDVHPAMGENACINLFTQSETYKTEYAKILKEVSNFEEGGKKVKERDKIIDKYSYLKSEEYTKIIKNTELSNEELEKQLFSLSVNDLERKIREKLRETVVKTVDYWGDEYEYQKYYLEDILVEENMVICEDSANWYKYFGIPYSINGDEVVLDIENAKRYVRGDWREFVEGDKELSGQAFSEMSEIIKNKAISLKEQFDKANEELQDMKSKYVDLQSDFSKVQKDNQELAKFKADIDKQIKDKEIEEELKPFEALAELDEYKEIYARRYELSLDKLVKEMKVLAFDNGKLISKQGKKKFEKGIIKVPVIEKDLNIPKVDKAWSILDKHIK